MFFESLPWQFQKLISYLAPILGPIFSFIWQIFINWWWIFLPFFLWRPFIKLWIWWRNEAWDKTQKRVLLEIRIPETILKPTRAMDQVFAGIHALHDVVVFREKWFEGQFQLNVSLEIASIDGVVHFFIRTPESFRGVLESAIYSQYPEVEISEAEDYTKKVPADIPNKEWDVFGFDMINTKPNPYPLKTYAEFESEHESKEEKRIDPLSSLLEGMSSLKPGEQLWVQIVAKPIREEIEWAKEGHEIIEKTIKKEKVKKGTSMIQEAIDILLTGNPAGEKEGEKEVMPSVMRLTPAEKDLIENIDNKISKFGYSCTMRFLYLAKKEVFFKGRARIPFSFYKAISKEGLGGVKPWKVTQPKVKTVFLWFLDKRRTYLKKRKIFTRYLRRLTPLFPRPGGTFVLNTEELATLFHFPSKITAPAPSIPRIEGKKGEAPAELPVE